MSSVSDVNLGLPYTEGQQASNSRRNATMVMSGKGSEIAAIPTTQQIPLFRCLETSGGLIADELYFRSASNQTFINVRRKHTHASNSDADGGIQLDQFIFNPKDIHFGLPGYNTPNDWVFTSLGTATYTEGFNTTNGRFYMLKSTYVGTTGNYFNVSAMSGGTGIGFSEKVYGIVKMVMDYQINQIARMGFGMEEVQAGTDPSRKAGLEMCGSTGVNWQGVSANGVTRTVSSTSMPSSSWPNYKTYQIYFNPTNSTIKILNSDGTLKVITSTVPSGGQIDPTRNWRMGIQTTNTQEKVMYVNRVKFDAKNNDPIWPDGPPT
jgi:hypothetical protein